MAIGSEQNNTCLDVVTTATIRPEVLNITFLSFFNKFLYQFSKLRLIINIDPIGNNEDGVNSVLKICRQYFKDIVYRNPDKPSFSKAVHWGWQQVKTDYFLHLEDDWLLRKQIDYTKVINYLNTDQEIASITFDLCVNKQDVFRKGLALRPSIYRREFISQILPLFDDEADPEKQWKIYLKNDVLKQWKFRNYGNLGDGRFVIDIGKKWRKLRNYKKLRVGAKNTIWGKGRDLSVSKRTWRLMKYHFFMRYWSMLAKQK